MINLSHPIDEDSCFYIGRDNFGDLIIGPSADGKGLYYIMNNRTKQLVKNFILTDAKPQVDYVCRIHLIKKEDKFIPYFEVATRDKSTRRLAIDPSVVGSTDAGPVKARVDLSCCIENFWHLIHFLEGLEGIEIPQGKFSMVAQEEKKLVDLIRARSAESVKSIVIALGSTMGAKLSQQDINQMLRRREKLEEFRGALITQAKDESFWANFFKDNKWVFGYGLNYQILRPEQSQPVVGGTRVDGGGYQKSDSLVSTVGDVRFTVLVEIKTPSTELLAGKTQYRNGAWALGNELTGALAQLQADLHMWDHQGSKTPTAFDEYEVERRVHTVNPRGIIVVGSLDQVKGGRSKWETFERFRQSIHGIDILTYDELFERAKYIVESSD